MCGTVRLPNSTSPYPANMEFVSLVSLPNAFTLGGAKAAAPFEAGSVILGRGTFEGSEETDDAYFVVLRSDGKGVYLMAPLGTADKYWHSHLERQPQVRVKLLQHAKEKLPADGELLRRWRVLAGPTEDPEKDAFVGLSKVAVDKALKRLKFCRDNVVSDVPRAKDMESYPNDGNRKAGISRAS